jgi:hypothetical protein
MTIINTDAVNNSIDNKSFALLRTNPKLTSNLKLLVNSNGDLFLSSFRANKELSKIEYQKYDVKSSGIYSIDIANFYKNLPLTQRYETLVASSDITLFSEYEFQYEDQYQYGAIQNTTKLYDEQYKIFAPIWLEKQVPSKFVIYRVEDVDYKTDYTEDTAGQNSRILELLKNATIIKTFDLGISSKIGEYLNTHVNDKRFPNSALTINFKEGSQSTFNGIDIVNGGFTIKTEQLDRDYVQVDYPEIFSNQTITNGFERNGIISANIVNLEFMFDDYTAENYKIYRYFGIYADDIDEGNFGVIGLENDGKLSIDSNTYKTYYDYRLITDNVNLIGIDLFLPDIDLFPSNSQFEIPTIQYVKDRSGIFYNIKNSFIKEIRPEYIEQGITIPSLKSYKFLISQNNKDEKSFIGYSKNGKKITAIAKNPSYKGFIRISIHEVPGDNDRLFIGDKNEIAISQYNLGDYLIIATSTLPAGRADGNKFSNKGSLQQIAIAIASAISNGEIITYKTKVIGTSIIIEEIVSGNNRRQTILGVYLNNSVDFIDENNGSGSFYSEPFFENDWLTLTTIAGSVEGQSILVESSEIGEVEVGEYLKQKDSDKFVRIIEIVQDPFEPDYYRVILNKATKLSNDKVYEVYEEYKTVHGKFAAYDFKDFDFDFYSTRNSDLGDLIYDFDELSSIDATSFYSGLRDILSAETSETVTKKILLNEYERLKENSLKETALLSRVVPTICKYQLKDASNARNLPYVLNVNEAFGDDNLSPNIEIDSKRNVDFFNMEHFHLNRIPTNILGDRKDLNNYLDFANDGGLTIDKLISTEFNYFDKHFNWTGYFDSTVSPSGKWFDNEYKRLWSKFDDGNFEKNSSTVFRGLRYVFQKRKEITNEIPTEFLKGVDVSDYKFGAYLSYNVLPDATENDGIIPSNSIVFNCVKNDKFKFICVNIELNVVRNDVHSDEMNRYLLYTLTDLKEENTIIDTRIPFNIDIAGANIGATKDTPFIVKAHDTSINKGTAKFTNFIRRDFDGEYSWIYFTAVGGTWGLKVLDVIDDSTILVSGYPYEFSPATTGQPPVLMQPVSRMSSNDISKILITGPFYYLQGGKNEFANLLDSITAYKYSQRFNSFGQINYTTIDEDGNSIENDFILSIESGVDVAKPSTIVPMADGERPKAYALSSNQIGNVIEEREDGGYVTILRRMNGDYNPIFNNIITFSDIDSYKKVDNIVGVDSSNSKPLEYSNTVRYNALNGKGISFDSFKENTGNYGFISNYFYHKVNEKDSKNILKLSQTSDKLPLYPLIGEIAIDKKEMNVFKSKYSKDYFTRALGAGESEITNGTLSPVEKKTFMSSTIMKVRDTYDITKFDNIKEPSIEVLDKIRFANSNKASIHWVENGLQIIADFYLSTAILNELIEDGIERQFQSYVNATNSYGDKSSIQDDLKIYSGSNITPRFIIDSIKVYGIQGKVGKGLFNQFNQTQFVSVTQTSQLTIDNYRELTDFNIQSYQNDSLSFRLIYNKKPGYLNRFKVHVKIQA